MLQIAVDLSRRFGLNDLADNAIERSFAMIQEGLESGDPKPGVPLGLLRLLIDNNTEDARIDQLLLRAREVLPTVHDTMSTIELQRRRATPEGAADLDRQLIRALIDAAAADDVGLRRAHWLDTAIRIAGDRGVTDLRDEATRLRQAMTVDDFDMQTFTSGIELPNGYVERLLEWHADVNSWPEALDRFAWTMIPSGRYEDNVESVAEQDATFVLQNLFPIQIIDADGMSVYDAATDEDRADVKLVQHEWMATQVWASIGAAALQRLVDELGPPDVEEIEHWLAAREHVDQSVARSIARALRHWADGDFEAAAAIGLPKVERLVRDFLLVDNAPLYRNQLKDRPGQYPGLRALLPALEDIGVDKSLLRHLESTFAHVAGANLRNEFAHGYLTDPGPQAGAVVLHALVMLATLGDIDGLEE